MMQELGKLFRVEEAASMLGVQPATIRRRILERRIDFVKIGRSVRIPEKAIDKLITAGLHPSIGEDR